MHKIRPIKEIYTEGYAKTSRILDNPRIIEIFNLVEKNIPKNLQRILDLGCGDGSLSAELGKILEAKEIYGIDISAVAVKEALSRNIKAVALDTDEENLPFEDNCFDFIFCGSLIELVVDPDRLLEEACRVLKKDSYLIVSFPNLCAWASRLAVLSGFLPYYSIVSRKYEVGKLFIPVSEYKNISKGFVRLYTLRSFKQLAGKYGLKVVKARGARENAMPIFMKIIDRALSKIPALAFQIICVLKKC